MRPFLTALAVSAVAIVPAQSAGAAIIEIGQTKDVAKPACPAKPCLAVSRTTGYQAKVGATRGLMTIPESGRIVAWTIALGTPGPTQTAYFDTKLGGTSQAGISILKPGDRLFGRVQRQSPLIKLQPYFGTVAQFPLVKSIPVQKGWTVALTVPTWAPALAVGLPGDTSWRASRPKGTCDDIDQAQTAQVALNDLAQYFCLYRTARLTYTATLVTYAKRAKGTTTTTTTTSTTTTPTSTSTTPTTTTPTTTTPTATGTVPTTTPSTTGTTTTTTG